MSIFDALILGIIQGLTEFLPVSSSGHIELGKAILGVEITDSLTFTLLVHLATVLSTIVIFRKVLLDLIIGVFSTPKFNEEKKYALMIILSMVPVGIIGVLFKDDLEALFTGKIVLVGLMLCVTAVLLSFTYYKKNTSENITYGKALIIGIAQSIAVLPGISRSGATIATALLLNVKKEEASKFSFLMVLAPIIGGSLLEFKDVDFSQVAAGADSNLALLIGFIAAFASGLFACKIMINIVNKGKLIYFAIYCLIAGLIAIFFG
ncbi:MAG: undecaprenyl-diphosphatase [Sphingobacteriales bacterium]|jgi:undecaprenyl-diphosphatase